MDTAHNQSRRTVEEDAWLLLPGRGSTEARRQPHPGAKRDGHDRREAGGGVSVQQGNGHQLRGCAAAWRSRCRRWASPLRNARRRRLSAPDCVSQPVEFARRSRRGAATSGRGAACTRSYPRSCRAAIVGREHSALARRRSVWHWPRRMGRPICHASKIFISARQSSLSRSH